MSTGVAATIKPEIRSHFYHPELDVLRFCAAVAVFIFHGFYSVTRTSIFGASHGLIVSPLLAMIGSGGYGVDLFFVISSFLITQLLLREREETGTLDVRAFYLRRILRIWPLYFFFIGVCWALTFVTHSQHLEWKYIAGFLFLSGNWVFIFSGTPRSVAAPLWSISLEEQFYLCWPQVMKRAGIQAIARVAWGLLVVATIVRVILAWHGVEADTLWFNTFVRLDPLALGILLAVYTRQHPLNVSKIERAFLGLSGIVCWLLVTHFCNLLRDPLSFWKAVVGYPVLAIASAALLVSAYGAPQVGSAIFANKRLAYLGKISYGIYVYHQLCLLISQSLFGRYTKHFVCVFVAFLLTLLFAAISYRFIEAPFLRLKERFAHVRSRPV